MTTPREIADYLKAIPNARVHDVVPCSIQIGAMTYPAAKYRETLETSPGCRAYAEGQREYTREMIYLAGYLPSCKRRGNVVFRFPNDQRDWYVAGYYPAMDGRFQPAADPASEFAPFHPFGANFLMAPWDIAGSAIDEHERHPYRRVSVKIQEN